MSSLAEEAAKSAEIPLPICPKGAKLMFVKFQQIRLFNGHPFRLYRGDRLDDMVESIRKNGILVPLIVRRIDDPTHEYEMLAGHNRMNAAQKVGLEGAWCLVKDNLSDQDALMYVVETNLLQRSFSELLPSEKAAVLALRYSEMFSQGKRNDILDELKQMEGGNSNSTSGTEFQRLNSRDAIGQNYELTGRQIANYLRIDKLTSPLKLRLDNGDFIIKVGVTLSFIGEKGQRAIDAILSTHKLRIDENTAVQLRSSDSRCPLNEKTCLEILIRNTSKKRGAFVKVSKEVCSKYFAPNTAPKDIEQTIDAALNLYFSINRTETA